MPRSPHRRLSTRVLLICAALAAVHLLLHIATVPLLTALAPLAPPLYAFVAGLHSLMPFLARRLTDVPGAALLTGGIAAVFVSMTSPSGLIVAVPLLVAGAAIDVVVWRSRGTSRPVRRRYLLAAVCVGTALTALSLVVFSPAHLTPPIVLGTLAGRIIGEVLVAALSGLLATALHRAGVGRALDTSSQSSPSS